MRRAHATGGEPGVDARGHDVDPPWVEAQLDHLVLGRRRQGDHPAAAVDRRGDPALDDVADLGQLRGQDHLPHVGVDVVQEDDAGHRGPQRREERHAVPDLDQAVGSTVGVAHLGQRGAGEHQVATGLADHLVAVAPAVVRVALGPRGAHEDLDAGLGPQPGDGGGVDLGSAGLDVVEVAPGDHVDPVQARGRRRCHPASARWPLGRRRTAGAGGSTDHRVGVGPRVGWDLRRPAPGSRLTLEHRLTARRARESARPPPPRADLSMTAAPTDPSGPVEPDLRATLERRGRRRGVDDRRPRPGCCGPRPATSRRPGGSSRSAASGADR